MVPGWQPPRSGYIDAKFETERTSDYVGRHLREAEERSERIKERISEFCRNRGFVKSLQRRVSDAYMFMVDPDHKVAYCRHGKVRAMGVEKFQ